MRLVIYLILISVVLPATLIVPTDYPTILAGFQDAMDGDTVLVLDGTYSGDGNVGLVFDSDDRIMFLISENGAENCIIDCQGQDRFISITDTQIKIDGFQILNGYAESGGAILAGAGCTIYNCTFANNVAGAGGAIYLLVNMGEIHKCIFRNNVANYQGGALLSALSSTIISHCLFYNNSTLSGEGTILLSLSSPPHFINSILLGSIYGEYGAYISHCIFPVDIFNVPTEMPDPYFVDPDSNDFHIEVQSPCINAGTTELNDDPNYFPLDPDGTQPDIGVYPYFLELPGDTNFDGEVDVIDIVQTVDVIMGDTEPFNAQIWAMNLNGDCTIDVLDIVLMVGLILS